MTTRILISAGEVSGDQHLARVLRSIFAVRPETQIRGMAGNACAQAGAHLDVDCYRSGAGMGFLELFRSGGKILSSFRTLVGLCESWKPDLLILVDYPDFNLRLAKKAKKLGIKVLYYIPPKVWAWRSGRIRAIRRYVDRVAAIFPFEKEFYERHGCCNVTYVGHPLSERVVGQPSAESRIPSVLLLPGSRKFEVERLLVPMLQAFEIVRSKHPELRPIVVLAPNIEASWVREVIGDSVSSEVLSVVEWTHEDALHAMERAQVGVLKSGTCNLEGAMARLPFVCVYSGTLFAKVVVSTLVALREYSPVNIIKAGTVKELIQTRLSPEDVAREVLLLLDNNDVRRQMVESLTTVSTLLCSPDTIDMTSGPGQTVSERVALCAFEMVNSERGHLIEVAAQKGMHV